MSTHPLLQRCADRIATLADPDTTGLLVGFSGGPDSLFLLRAALHWHHQGGGTVEAAHLHHGLRGAEADGDLEFCRARCRDLGVVLHEDRVDPRPVAKRRGRGLEEAARHLRHTWLEGLLAKRKGLDLVALGHHRDDQAETVLMRLFRGTGPDGLAGMRPRRGPIVRPLLETGREDILSALTAMGESWRRDSTNLDGENLRAVMRRKLLPVVEEVFGPGAWRRPTSTAHLLSADLNLLDQLTDEAVAAARHPDDASSLHRERLLALDPALAGRVLRRFLGTGADGVPQDGSGLVEEPGLVHIRSALEWLRHGQSGTSQNLPGGRKLVLEFDRVHLAPTAPIARCAADYRVAVAPVPCPDPEQTGRLEGMGTRMEDGWRIHCHAASLAGNLRIAHPRPGDRMRPLGRAGTMKLSDLLREARIPASERPSSLVVRDDQGIIWVIGVARDERTRMLPTGDKIVTISVVERRSHPQQTGT